MRHHQKRRRRRWWSKKSQDDLCAATKARAEQSNKWQESLKQWKITESVRNQKSSLPLMNLQILWHRLPNRSDRKKPRQILLMVFQLFHHPVLHHLVIHLELLQFAKSPQGLDTLLFLQRKLGGLGSMLLRAPVNVLPFLNPILLTLVGLAFTKRDLQTTSTDKSLFLDPILRNPNLSPRIRKMVDQAMILSWIVSQRRVDTSMWCRFPHF